MHISQKRGFLSRFIVVFTTFAFVLMAAPSLYSQSALVINPNGGDNLAGTDGIKIVVSQTGNIMLFKYGKKQKWSTADWDGNPNNPAWNAGMTLALRFNQPGGTLNNNPVGMTFCSKTDITGTGTASDPYTLSLQGVARSPISLKDFYITIVIQYSYPNNYYIADYYVRAPYDLTQPEEVHFYMYQDDYIIDGSGSSSPNPDAGYGFIGPIVSGASRALVGTYNNYGTHSIKVDGVMQSYYVGGPHAGGGNQTVTNLHYNNHQGTTFEDIDICVHFSTPAVSHGELAVRRMLRGITGPNTMSTFETTPVVAPTLSPSPSTPVTVNFTSTTVSEPEGDADHTAGGIKIRVEGGILANDQVLTFYIQGGTAAQNVDYTYLDGFTIPAGNYTTPREFTIPNFTIRGNTAPQANRTIVIGMRAYCNDLIGVGTSGSCTYTILDDDSLTAHIEAVRNTAEGSATSGRFRIWFTNSSMGNILAPVTHAVTLSYSTAGSTASTADYTWATAGVTASQISVPSGTSEMFIDFTANTDYILEGTETLKLALTAATPTTITIDNTPAQVSIDDMTDGAIIVKKMSDAAEPSTSGLFQVCFEDTRVTAVRNVEVTYTVSGTAVSGTDYQSLTPSPVIITAGNKCANIPVNVINNYIVEGGRELILTINSATLQ